MSRKRKVDSDSLDIRKRLKLTTASGFSQAANIFTGETSKKDSSTPIAKPAVQDSEQKDINKANTKDSNQTISDSKRRRIKRLVPPRPFPTVPTSVSATGPRSAHIDGKNYICLTRKTPLGAYMRRCKDVILKDGCVSASFHSIPYSYSKNRYKSLYLSAMGAAIPLLLQLSMALPPILPFPTDEIHTEVTTGTVEVQDEVVPEDEDEDIMYQTRGKSTLRIVIKIGDGEFDGDRRGLPKKNGKNRGGDTGKADKRQPKQNSTAGEIVYQEPEQEDMEML